MHDVKEGEDYMFLPDPSDAEGFIIKVMTGPYIGVTYFYENIVIREDPNGGEASINFKYVVISTPEPSPILSVNDFELFTFRVLYDIMLNSDEETIRLTDKDGNELTDYDPPKYPE